MDGDDIHKFSKNVQKGKNNMATLFVLKFPTPEGADEFVSKVQSLDQRQLIKIEDAAIVTWPVGRKGPKTRQVVGKGGQIRKGALDGTFWGMLFGLIFFTLLGGAVVGAAVGALSGALRDYGIDDDFIKETREKVTEGTSALFLLTSGAVKDKVIEELKGEQMDMTATIFGEVTSILPLIIAGALEKVESKKKK